MNKDYVSLETAKLLKELGCKVKSDFFYTTDGELKRDLSDDLDEDPVEFIGDGILAPLLHDAQKWLREKSSIHIEVHLDSKNNFQFLVNLADMQADCSVRPWLWYNTYESALDAGIAKACEILKNNRL